jgi:thioredoxin-related protein
VVSGIQWTHDLSWAQVKEKAKRENKYIFLDCFTTWCGPCKRMDSQVYPSDSVGDYFNQRFISVKVQMDKTKKDNEDIQRWYDDAAAIHKQYRVEGYPTYIFLSAQSVIVQKDMGYKEVKDLVALAQAATTPGKVFNDPYEKYDKLMEAYKQGAIKYDSLQFMIRIATKLRDTIMQRQLLKTHVDYECNLSPEQRYTRENIQFWASYSLGSKTRLFSFFYKDGDIIDKVMNQKDYARTVIDRTIMDEIVTPFLKEQAAGSGIAVTGGYLTDVSGKHLLKTDYSEADWKKLDKMICEKYTTAYAKRNVLSAKIEWYLRHRNYYLYAKYYLIKLDEYPPDIKEGATSAVINEFAWNVFLNITDKNLIKRATRWIEKVVIDTTNRVSYEWMDTYANLLYKAGRKQDAIQWEEKAMSASREPFAALYSKVIEQMKRGEPTYGAVWGYN